MRYLTWQRIARRCATRYLLISASTCMATLALAQGCPTGTVPASQAITYQWDAHTSANDFHFTFHVPPSDINSTYFVTYSFTTNPAGSNSTTVQLDSSGRVHSVSVDVTGISLNYLQSITVNVNVCLNQWNVLVLDDLYFTINGVRASKAPGLGFKFPRENVPLEPHWTTYTLFNPVNPDSGDFVLTVPQLEFAWDPAWYSAEEQWSGVGVPIYTAVGPFTLAPGDSVSLEVFVPNGPDMESHIYIGGELIYDGASGDPLIAPFVQGHGEELEGPVFVERVTWGDLKAVFRDAAQ